MNTGLKLALIAGLAGAAAWAQAPQKIAVINMQEALVSTGDGKKAIADLRAKYGPRDAELQKRAADLQAKQEQYRKTQATLSDENKAKIETDIATLTRTIQRDEEDMKQDTDQDQQRVTNELGGKIMQVLTKYAADNQFTLVFDVSGQPNNILFASNAVDITRDIIAAYDKAAPATSSAAPAPAPPAKP